MNDRPGYLYILSLLAFIAGGVIPLVLLGDYLPETEWSDKTQSVMFISMVVIIAWVFNKVGRRNNKLKVWSTDTVIGVTLMLFSFSFLVMFSVNVFLLIPLPSLILFIVSLLCSILGCVVFFSMSDKKN